VTLKELIKIAIEEDMPKGDVTTESLALPPKIGRARLVAKQDLFLSGTGAFEQTMLLLEPNLKLKWHFDEGDSVLKGQSLCTLFGDLLQILKAERVALNFLMKLSGISTLTNQFVEKIKGTSTKILDTRKTTPGYRELEKKAVVHGGGQNHRLNLSDAILIKDNHISVMGGITAAVKRVRANSQLPLEVEAATYDQVLECVDLGVHRILLDNMNNEQLKRACDVIPDSIQAEASGNMSLERVRGVAEIGVDFISVGALTHSANSCDVSLLFSWDEK
jgi:nicotinate-nucleotide pyrophosphorylase (carboxylating)